MPSPLAEALEALKTALTTSRHAELVFDLLVDVLGDQGVVWTANDGRLRKLFRRDALDATLVVPWPVAELAVGGRIGWVSPTFDTRTGEVVPDPERPPAKVSRLRGLGPAEFRVFDGAATLGLVFGEHGGFQEASSHDPVPSRLPELATALASRQAPPAELMAACVARFDPAVHGPGRVRLPVGVPMGPEGTWTTGLLAARRALFSGRVPAEARYVVADGVSGSAVGFGPTLAAATAAFEAQVAVASPAPDTTTHTLWDDDDDGNLLRRGEMPGPGDPMPDDGPASDEPWAPATPPGTIDPTGGPVHMTGPEPDVPLPPITLATVPRVIVPLSASPPGAPPFGRWVRTIGAMGATAHAARLDRPEGFVQVGERLFGRVDPRTLDATLDDLDAASADVDAAFDAASVGRAFVRYRSTTYRWAEARGRRPAGLERAVRGGGPHFDGSGLDGDVEAWSVRRHVRVPRPT